jgi:bifunctional DNase/RNase
MLGAIVLTASAVLAQAPSPAVREAKAMAPGGFVEMFVATVMPTPDGHTVVLVNPDEEVLLPVGVALPEAVTIYGRLEHKRAPRPMTHDLLDGVVAALGARVVRVQIEDLVDGQFIGTVVLQGTGGAAAVALDARAADALAIALSAKAPIFVAKPVMERAALTHDDLKRMPSPGDKAAPALPPSPEGKARVFDL